MKECNVPEDPCNEQTKEKEESAMDKTGGIVRKSAVQVDANCMQSINSKAAPYTANLTL